MTKEQIIAFRENAKQSGKQVFLWLDNALVFYENLRDCEAFIWDDDNEVVYIIGPIRNGDSVYIKAGTPYEMYTFDYAQVQGMGLYLDMPALIVELDKFKTRGLITAEQYEEYLNKLAPLSRINTHQMTRTMKTYTEEEYKEFYKEKENEEAK